MAVSSSLQLSLEFGICSNHEGNKRFRNRKTRGKLCLLATDLSSVSLFQRQYSWSTDLSKRIHRRVCTIPSRNHQFQCHCFLNPGQSLDATSVKNAALKLARSFNHSQGNPLVMKLSSAIAIVIFAIWGLGPLVRQSRNIFLGKNDSTWKKSSTYHVMTSYIQPLLLWTGAIFICSVIQEAHKFLMETSEPTATRTMGFQFAGRAVSTAVWVAAVSLFMELLGFSTQKWVTAGGLGTVLLTLAGREILTNFLSSAMIHTTRPFVLNEWIQTKIQGYEVSGTVEHVGWWSQTIVRGDDREAIHIPNHKFTVNVVRNLSQKTHWRIKTHLAISHLDVGKINNIVADMRKVLAKNPQVEQQKLHRRIFLDNISSENQALLILVSCFVKTSHFEEYLCVKEAILQDLLRVVRHHRARLATPIRTVQKIFKDADLDSIPFSESLFNQGAASKQPVLLIEPTYKVNGDDKTKTQPRPAKPTPDSKMDGRDETETKEDPKIASKNGNSTMKSKADGTSSVIKPSMEENIVLGVALDGSKRTLPIEEDMEPSSKADDVKELTAMRSGNGSAVSEKEKSDVKQSKGPGSPGGDRLDQQD
ncbi:hypothetical protein BUALT_Bualt11G0024400 [Buddleja alternifolia]|uniref:Uncharacterized protein n=1 Tax=Buddleja alternifolia TaxID=168488 RepID=A0AAV6WS06_9LAMI|nr:hypothetical protein BUALT_Bualt11G0024400 [Buddleja alternifolia]